MAHPGHLLVVVARLVRLQVLAGRQLRWQAPQVGAVPMAVLAVLVLAAMAAMAAVAEEAASQAWAAAVPVATQATAEMVLATQVFQLLLAVVAVAVAVVVLALRVAAESVFTVLAQTEPQEALALAVAEDQAVKPAKITGTGRAVSLAAAARMVAAVEALTLAVVVARYDMSTTFP